MKSFCDGKIILRCGAAAPPGNFTVVTISQAADKHWQTAGNHARQGGKRRKRGSILVFL